MQYNFMRMKLLLPLVLLCNLLVIEFVLAEKKTFSPYVDKVGNIQFPHEFRTSMTHLGSWFVPEGGASGFHGVYTDKETVKIFRETGSFPDGATLVKELRASASSDYTTGANVKHETEVIKQWFVMIKDSKARFPNNKVWGDGWGWALFKPDDLSNNRASNYKVDCLACHIPAKEKDWIYTEAYPILKVKN
jgi:hypothetical protein